MLPVMVFFMVACARFKAVMFSNERNGNETRYSVSHCSAIDRACKNRYTYWRRLCSCVVFFIEHVMLKRDKLHISHEFFSVQDIGTVINLYAVFNLFFYILLCTLFVYDFMIIENGRYTSTITTTTTNFN